MRLSRAKQTSPNDTTLMVILTITHKKEKVNIFLSITAFLCKIYIIKPTFLYYSQCDLKESEAPKFFKKIDLTPKMLYNNPQGGRYYD